MEYKKKLRKLRVILLCVGIPMDVKKAMDSIEKIDTDGDGLPDKWERLNKLNPADAADAKNHNPAVPEPFQA